MVSESSISWKVLREEVLCQGTLLEIIRRVIIVNGREAVIEVCRRPPGTRSMIVNNGALLLLKEFRTEYNGWDYRLPGGKVVDCLHEFPRVGFAQEQIRAAALREIREETGYELQHIEFFHLSRAGAAIEWDLHYFFSFRDAGKQHKQRLDGTEIISVEWVPLSAVYGLCIHGHIHEDRTVGVLLRFLHDLSNQPGGLV